MDINVENLAMQCVDAINQKLKSLTKLNIVVCGKTGVGKSTLINSVFRENLATTGIGRPVTDKMRLISKPDFPLNIYDTRGFELGSDEVQDKTMQEILSVMKDGYKSKDINSYIHCMWYCINATSDRFEEEERKWLAKFLQQRQTMDIPVIVVITKAVSRKQAEALKNSILDENLDVTNVIPVLAQDYEIDDEYTKKAYGLDVLIQHMCEVLPEELHDTLQNVQKVALKEKKKRAQKAVAVAASAALAEGFVPVAFADAAMLIPTQVGMIASITAIYGIAINKAMLVGFLSSVLGTSGATIAGRTVATGLLKLVPGAGTVVGGTISGATAAAITTALGEAYILLIEAVAKGEMNQSDLLGTAGIARIKEILSKKKADDDEIEVIIEEMEAIEDIQHFTTEKEDTL